MKIPHSSASDWFGPRPQAVREKEVPLWPTEQQLWTLLSPVGGALPWIVVLLLIVHRDQNNLQKEALLFLLFMLFVLKAAFHRSSSL